MCRVVCIMVFIGLVGCKQTNKDEFVFLETDKEITFINTPVFIDGFYFGLAYSQKPSHDSVDVVGLRGVERLELSKDSKFILIQDTLGQQAIIIKKGSSPKLIQNDDNYPLTFLETKDKFPFSRNNATDSLNSKLVNYIINLLENIGN